MAKVLLFAADVVPVEDFPAFGGGMRGLQIYRALKESGHEVLVSCPLDSYLGRTFADQIPKNLRALNYSDRSQDSIYREVRPDLVVFASNWTTVAGPWWPDCPTVVDLCGPALIEAIHATNQTQESMASALCRKLEVIAQADLLLCAGERQQWYFRQALALSGISLDRPSPLRVMPLGVDPSLIQERPYPEEPKFVYAGGLYPWQDPSACLEAVLEVIERRKRGWLFWYGGSLGQEPSANERFERLTRRVRSSPRGKLHGLLTLSGICEALRSMSVSVELMAPNVERELALATRTPLALGLGLPVLYGDYAELSPAIREYEAGWTVDCHKREELVALVEEVLNRPEEVVRRGRNAQRLAHERLRWDRICKPLVEFAAHPEFRADKQPSPFPRGLGALTPGEVSLLRLLRAPALQPFRKLMRSWFRKTHDGKR